MVNHLVVERKILVRADDCSGAVSCSCGWNEVVGPVDGPVAAHHGVRAAWAAHVEAQDAEQLSTAG